MQITSHAVVKSSVVARRVGDLFAPGSVQLRARSWKTWKVMEFQFPGQESHGILSEGHGKSWKGNMLGTKIFLTLKKKITDESETPFVI